MVSSTGPNTMKINNGVLRVYCSRCKNNVVFFGQSEEECIEGYIRHCYEHSFPVWRQRSSMEDDMPYEAYRKLFNIKKKNPLLGRSISGSGKVIK